jgi:MFS family permease
MAEASYRQVLRLPQVSALLLAGCLARLAGRMFALAIILYALNRFGSPLLAGWVSFASIGPGLIASPFAGALLDRLRAPLAIIVDMLASAILLLLLMLADWAGMAGAPLLIAIATMYSLTSPLSGSGVRVLIPRLVPNEALERANALDTGSYALIEIIGPALAGGLSRYAGAQATMLVIASLDTMAAVSLIPLRRGSEGSGRVPSIGLIAQAGAGLVYVARHRSLRGLAVSYCLYQMSWGVLLVVVPVAISRGLTRLHMPIWRSACCGRLRG